MDDLTLTTIFLAIFGFLINGTVKIEKLYQWKKDIEAFNNGNIRRDKSKLR